LYASTGAMAQEILPPTVRHGLAQRST
jgi:hypothetical protein